MLLASTAFAQPATTPTTLPSVPLRANGKPDFGIEGWVIPQGVRKNTNSPRTVQLLGAAVAGEREKTLPHRRAQLLGEIAQCKLPEGSTLIGQSLRDPDPIVRAAAAAAAAANEDPSLLGPLARLMDDQDPSVRRAAVIAHARLAGNSQADPQVMAKALTDTDMTVVSAALSQASSAQHAAAIAMMLDSLSPSLRSEGIDALARIGDLKHADAVAASLKGSVPLRAAAVRALGVLKAASRQQEVIAAVRDPHPTVRREAMLAVGRIVEPPQRFDLAMGMLNDPDLTVREAAVQVLTPCPTALAAKAIAGQLSEPYRPLRHACREALAKPASDEVKQAAIEQGVALLDNPNPRRREDGSYVLGRLRSTAGWDKHMALLSLKDVRTKDVQWSVMRQAAESMGWIGDPRCGDALKEIADIVFAGQDINAGDLERGGPSEVLVHAIIAAGRVGHKPIAETGRKILAGNPEFQPGEWRATAAFALYSVLEPGTAVPGVFSSGLNNPHEGGGARHEYVKGLGAMRAKSAVGTLEKLEAQEGPEIAWIAHWSLEQIQGKPRPYTPRPQEWRVNVSIQDISDDK